MKSKPQAIKKNLLIHTRIPGSGMVEYSNGEYSLHSPLLNKIQSSESATNAAVASTSGVATAPDVVSVAVVGVVVIGAAGADVIVDGSEADVELINHDDFRCCCSCCCVRGRSDTDSIH